jgi:lysophospholipase L1-like esterase
MGGRDLRTNLLVLLVALAVSVLLAEGAVRLLLPQDLSGSWMTQTDTGLRVNKSHGSARHQFGRRVVRYRFAEPHLRDVTLTRAESARRILVLGDSFTFGWLLSDADTHVARLQGLVDAELGAGKFVLLNAATGGWGTADYAFFLEDFGPQIRPDAVLVFVNTDDIDRSLTSPLLGVRSDAQGYVADRVPVRPSRLKQWLKSGLAYSIYQWNLEHSHLMQLIQRVRRTMPQRFGGTIVGPAAPTAIGPRGEASAAAPDPAALGGALFRRMRDWCAAHRVALWVTTTGFHNRDADRHASSESTAAFMASASQTFAALGVPYQDISAVIGETINAAPEQYAIAGEGHPNERAAQLIANAVYNGFLRERLLALR